MSCENCINRRRFIARAAGAAGAAALLAACGDGQLAGPPSIPRVPPIPPGSSKFTITVANFPGLANLNEMVQVASFQAAKRTGADTFDAFSMACTHAGCLLNIVSKQTFECPCHDSRFSNDGAVINGPNTGERINALQQLPTSYDPATDKLTIG